MKNNVIRFFSEEYENEQTKEKVTGVTVMVDGKFKQMLDVIIQKEGCYSDYTEVLKDIIFSGVEKFISKYR